VYDAATVATDIMIAPVIQPPVTKSPVTVLNPLNSKMINGKNPRTKFGIEIAAVARRLVPNCSAAIVKYKTDIPDPNPKIAHVK